MQFMELQTQVAVVVEDSEIILEIRVEVVRV
jgi:hypothetical protein